MTYRTALDMMLEDVKKKANAFATSELAGGGNELVEWEEAEKIYRELIVNMRKVRALPDDEIPIGLLPE